MASTRDRVNADPQRTFLESIDATLEKVLALAPIELSGDEAREVASRHIDYVARFNANEFRYHALVQIADIAELSRDYREYMTEHSRETVFAATTAKSREVAQSLAKEERKARELRSTQDLSERSQQIDSVHETLARPHWHEPIEASQAAGNHLAMDQIHGHSTSSCPQITNGGPVTMEIATQNKQREPIIRIGSNMPKPDWQESITLLKAQSPDVRGTVYLPKAEGEYGGKVMLITDTHIVQRVGRGTAVAHDLSKLDNGADLSSAIDAGTLKPGTHLRVEYGREKGLATVIPFNQQRAAEMQRDLSAWAEKNITNGKGRETFLKHVATATKDLGQPRTAQQSNAPEQQPRERTHAPQRSR